MSLHQLSVKRAGAVSAGDRGRRAPCGWGATGPPQQGVGEGSAGMLSAAAAARALSVLPGR